MRGCLRKAGKPALGISPGTKVQDMGIVLAAWVHDLQAVGKYIMTTGLPMDLSCPPFKFAELSRLLYIWSYHEDAQKPLVFGCGRWCSDVHVTNQFHNCRYFDHVRPRCTYRSTCPRWLQWCLASTSPFLSSDTVHEWSQWNVCRC
jgi:hypothetical protein